MPEERAGAGRRRYGNIPRMTVRSNAVSNAFPWGSDDVERRYRGYLPHLEGPNRVYFVTFRLADSLPEEVRAKLKARKANIRRRQAANEAAIPKVSRGPARDAGVTAREIEDTLDRGTGACHLRRADVAEIVASAIRHFDGQRYRLYAWCVCRITITPLCIRSRDGNWLKFSIPGNATPRIRQTGFCGGAASSGSASITTGCSGTEASFSERWSTSQTIPRKPG